MSAFGAEPELKPLQRRKSASSPERSFDLMVRPLISRTITLVEINPNCQLLNYNFSRDRLKRFGIGDLDRTGLCPGQNFKERIKLHHRTC